jgi:hypothetical protein
MPPSGLWKSLGRIAFWALVASVALGALGKGQLRLWFLAWAAALAFVSYTIFMLEMD